MANIIEVTVPNDPVEVVTVQVPGAPGPAGPSANLSIGTVAAGSTAAATITGITPNQVLNLTLPKGDKGDAGPQGIQGVPGVKGDPGDQGPQGIQGIPGLKGDQGIQGVKGDTGNTGPAGPANTLSIGTVSGGTSAAATITGTAPNQVLNLTLPKGDPGAPGPANTLTIGTVTTGSAGSNASATITGASPNQVLNLTIPTTALTLPYITVTDYGAVGDGVADDTAAINAALAACPEGGVVVFPVGTYLISSPLYLRRNRSMRGLHAGVWPYDTGGPCRIKANTGFTGDAIIRMQDEEELYGTVGAAANGLQVGPNDQSGQSIANLTLDGFNTVGGIDGIKASGLVRSVRLEHVSIRRCTGSGVHTISYTRADTKAYYPRGWRLTNVVTDSCGNMGFATNLLNDSTFTDCLAVGNATHGFYLAGPGETVLIGCRAAWNKGRGYYLTGTSYGNVLLSACTTDRSEQSGVYIDCTGTQPVVLSGCTFRRDGRNGGSGGGTYAGVYVNAATAPVVLAGVSTETGQDDDNTGAMSPQYGLRAATARSITVNSGVLWGNTAAYSDGGGNTNVTINPAVLRMTGSSNSPTYTYGGELTLSSYPGRQVFAKSTSGTDHVATFYQAATSGVDVASALNVTSDNPQSSAMYLSGTETDRGTLKIAHRGYADASDANAAAISVDLQNSGSAARGFYLWSSTGGTIGDALAVRLNGREDFVLKSTGRLGLGIPTGATPAGKIEINQNDDTTPGISIKANSTTASNLLEFKRSSDGAVRTRVDAQAQFVTQQTAYFAGAGIQLGATSTAFGGGSGVLGITDAGTAPATNPTGGGVLYSQAGALKWLGPTGSAMVLSAPTSAMISDAASAATANVVMKRDANGRAQVVDPSASADISTKNYVDTQTSATRRIQRSALPTLGAAYTLAMTDEGKQLYSPDATNTTVTIPTNAAVAFPVGAWIEFQNVGGGSVTLSGAAGVTLSAADGSLTTRTTRSVIRALKTNTDTWAVYGDNVNATASTVNAAVSAATASALMKRDASGRAQVADPSASADIATKNYVDGKTWPSTAISDSTATGRSLITAADATTARTAIGAGTSSLVLGTTSTTAKAGDYQPTSANITDAASAATANVVIKRDASGRAQVADPSVAADITTKNYVDTANTALQGQITTNTNNISTNTTKLNAATSSPTASQIVLRDVNGRAQVADPSASGDIATKNYVDGQVSPKAPLASPTFTGTASVPQIKVTAPNTGITWAGTGHAVQIGADSSGQVRMDQNELWCFDSTGAMTQFFVNADFRAGGSNPSPTVSSQYITKGYVDSLYKVGKTTATSDASSLIVVTHGLGATPTSVVCTPVNATTFPTTLSVSAVSSTTFTVKVYYNNAAAPSASATFYWAAYA